MKKKTYKAMNNRYYNKVKELAIEHGKWIEASRERDKYKEKAQFYAKRFRQFGKNVETVDPGSGELVRMLEWEIKPEAWGEYLCLYADLRQMSAAEAEQEIKTRLMKEIARGLIENDIVQFVYKNADMSDPLSQFGTIGGRLYVVPWEQMPHRRTLELKQYVEETEGEGAL